MTIKECIDIVDDLKPNQYSTKVKVMWLSFIDEIIINDVLKTHKGYDGRYDDFTGYSEDKLSVPLIVESPYDRLYTAYLKMKIDGENGETTRYNNSAGLFNSYMMEYRKFYNKTHMPLSAAEREKTNCKATKLDVTEAQLEYLKRELYPILAEDINSIANDVIDLQEGDALRQEEIMALDERVTVLETSGGGNITVDQTYSPESSNAQSGKAVAEAMEQNTETWEHIANITLEETAKNIRFSLEHEYSKVKVVGKFPSGVEVSQVALNLYEGYATEFRLGATTNPQVFQILIDCVSGNIVDVITNDWGGKKGIFTIIADKFKKIHTYFILTNINSNSDGFPTGTIFKLYGVRL